MAIGNNIKKYLAIAGRNQLWLAKQIDVTQVTISRYVNNERIPKIYDAVKIARALDITLEELLGLPAYRSKTENKRIAGLLQEIEYRDNKIAELEGQIIIKDGIIRKQAVMLME